MASATTATPSDPSSNPAAKLFDSVGPAYETAFEGLPEQGRAIQWLLGELSKTHPSAGAQCLDVGCGTGRPVCSSLAAAGHRILGVDVSLEMIKAARTQVTSPLARFEQQDVRSLPDTPAVYDAVTVFFSLIAAFSQDEIRDTLGRVHTWLKPGGLFVFATVPVPGDNLEIRWMGRPIVVSSLTRPEVEQCLQGVGFDLVEVRESTFLPKAVEAGICSSDEVWEEPHLFIYARKK